MPRLLVNISVLAAATLVALVAAEGVLALAGAGSLYRSGVSRLYDPVLLFRLPPNYAPEIDANGFRNADADGPFDVVFLGDSHT